MIICKNPYHATCQQGMDRDSTYCYRIIWLCYLKHVCVSVCLCLCVCVCMSGLTAVDPLHEQCDSRSGGLSWAGEDSSWWIFYWAHKVRESFIMPSGMDLLVLILFYRQLQWKGKPWRLDEPLKESLGKDKDTHDDWDFSVNYSPVFLFCFASHYVTHFVELSSNQNVFCIALFTRKHVTDGFTYTHRTAPQST